MRIYPQEQFTDMGIVDDDQTEDLRKKNAPGRCANTAEGDSNHHHANEEF